MSKSLAQKISCHTFVMLLPYRVKVSDTKVTHFTLILALCTCLQCILYTNHIYRNQYRWNKQNTAESQRLKIYVQIVHHSREHMHSNDYGFGGSVHCPVLVLRSCTSWNQGLRSTVTITGIQFCWICFCRISALFFGITTFFSKLGHRHIVHVTLRPCCRERRQSSSLQRCGHLIRQIWIWWTTTSAVCFKGRSCKCQPAHQILTYSLISFGHMEGIPK